MSTSSLAPAPRPLQEKARSSRRARSIPTFISSALSRSRRPLHRAPPTWSAGGRGQPPARSPPTARRVPDRKRVGQGTSVSVRVELGGRRLVKKKHALRHIKLNNKQNDQ